MKKERNYEAHGKKAEIIGASNNCLVFINGASHPAFTIPFKSIRQAKIRFLSWAANISK